MKRPILIGIGASHSGSGKTTLASTILRHFTGMTVPLSPQPFNPALTCGAIKFTSTSFPPELITDCALLMTHGKDTRQMLTSGARDVVWIRSQRSDLPDLLPKALKRRSHFDLIIVEGSSAIEFLKPDIVKFNFGEGR